MNYLPDPARIHLALIPAAILLVVLVVYRKLNGFVHVAFFILVVSIFYLFNGINAISTTALGILGSLQIALYFHSKPRLTTKKKVVFLSKANTAFSKNIVNGFKSKIDAELFETRYLEPGKSDDETPEWQIEELRKLQLTHNDFIVTIPVNTRSNYAAILCETMSVGTKVILVDYKYPNSIFQNHALTPPFFIYSDPLIGGNMIGEYMKSCDPDENAEYYCIVGSKESAVAVYLSLIHI